MPREHCVLFLSKKELSELCETLNRMSRQGWKIEGLSDGILILSRPITPVY